MRFKRIIAAVLALCIVGGAAPVFYHNTSETAITASAEEISGTYGDNIAWSFDSETGELTISGTGLMNAPSISASNFSPSTGSGTLTFRSDPIPWYNYRNDIKSIIVEEGVGTVCNYAFYCCNQVTSVSLPDSLLVIGVSAFQGCLQLKDVTLPEGLTGIGRSAFNGLRYMTAIKLPDSLQTIGAEAFSNCSSLESLNIPKNVSSVTMPCCERANSLAEFIVDEENDNFSSIDGVLFNKEQTTLLAYPLGRSDTSYTIPDGVEIIDNSAFADTSLVSVDLPDSLTTLKPFAFMTCESLRSVTIPQGTTFIGNQAFDYCSSLEKVTVLSQSCEFQGASVLPSTTVIYGYDDSTAQEFAEAYGRTFVSLGEAPAGPIATGVCGDNLKWVLEANGKLVISGTGDMYDFSDSSLEMPWYDYRKEITQIVIEEGATNLSAEAFFLCSAVSSVEIPSTVTDIDESALATCMLLEEINVAEGNPNYTSVDGVLFSKDMTALLKYPSNRPDVSYAIPDTVVRIADRGMWIMRNLTSLTLPDGLTDIGEAAFYNSKLLETIDIPESVSSIKWAAFSKTAWIEARQAEDPIVVVNGILIDGSACEGDVVIPEAVRTIGEYSFNNCEAITSVTIPGSVKAIDYCAFSGCIELAELNIGEGVEHIGTGAFNSCSALTEVTVPKSVTAIDGAAFGWCGSLEKITILNSDCEIADEDVTICTEKSNSIAVHYDGVICGYEGSTAQAYAEKYGYTFESLGEAPYTSTVYGDANCDGSVTMADAVLILQSVANPDKFGINGSDGEHLTEKGLLNADCSGNDGITPMDALTVQKYLLKLIDTLPEV